MRLLTSISIWLFAQGLSSAEEVALAPKVSEDMTWDEIALALPVYRPEPRFAEQRLKIMQSMDKLVTVHTRNMKDGDQERLNKIRDFYRKRVDIGLEKLEKTVVTKGVHVFKFYSSSMVLKAKDGTIAIDVAQGPVYNNNKEPEEALWGKFGFSYA